MRPPVTASLQFDPVNVRLLGSFRIGQVTLATLLPFVGGCGSQHGKVTKQTVLRVQMGMSISDAKMILGPPTHESEVLNLALQRPRSIAAATVLPERSSAGRSAELRREAAVQHQMTGCRREGAGVTLHEALFIRST